LFQLEYRVIVVEELDIGALELDIVCRGVNDDDAREKRSNDDVVDSGKEVETAAAVVVGICGTPAGLMKSISTSPPTSPPRLP
jgi:hypothetical protein